MNNNYDVIDLLSVLSIILQLVNYNSDLKSIQNEDIMQELQKQDREYFEKIIHNQEMVLENQRMIIDKLAK